MIDPLGFLLTSIRDNAAVAALTARIRGGEPAPGDALAPGSYQRFVVLVNQGTQRETRVAVAESRILARCYGTTFADAAVLAGAVSDAIHNIGPRRNAAGVLIFRSYDDIGQGAEKDPDTGQPHQDLVISAWAATQAVPIG